MHSASLLTFPHLGRRTKCIVLPDLAISRRMIEADSPHMPASTQYNAHMHNTSQSMSHAVFEAAHRDLHNAEYGRMLRYYNRLLAAIDVGAGLPTTYAQLFGANNVAPAIVDPTARLLMSKTRSSSKLLRRSGGGEADYHCDSLVARWWPSREARDQLGRRPQTLTRKHLFPSTQILPHRDRGKAACLTVKAYLTAL